MTNRKTKPKGGKRSRRALWVCLLVVCVAVLSLAAVTGAKYVLQWSPGVAQADAKAFYFTSDLLTGEGANTPVYQLANFVPGSSTIDFTLRNYADELRVSETDIVYSVTATGLSDTTGSITLSGTAGNSNTVQLSVPVTCFQAGKATISVTATATSPYTKSLKAVFELYQKLDAVTLAVYDAVDSNTATLTVTTGDSAGTVNITYPNNVYPDRTDSRLTVSGNTCSFNANANAQYSFVFFKSDPSQTVTGFTVGDPQ